MEAFQTDIPYQEHNLGPNLQGGFGDKAVAEISQFRRKQTQGLNKDLI